MGAFLIPAASPIVTVQYGLKYFGDGLGEAVHTTGNNFHLTSGTSFYHCLLVCGYTQDNVV